MAASSLPDAPAPEVPATLDRRTRIVIASVAVLLMLAALDQSIVATALPTIVAELGGLNHLSWVVTAYVLASTIVAPLYGKLGDLYGRRNVVFVSVGLFLGGSVLCGLAGSMGWLIAARAIQGLGGGGLFVLALSIVGDILPPRERGRIQGLFAVVFGTASVVGPLLGGFFTEAASWRWIFFINLPLGVVALAGFAMGFAPSGQRQRRAIDYAGAATLSLGLGALVLVTSLGGETLPWNGPGVWALAAAAVAGLAAFAFVETRAEEPLIPLDLFRQNTFLVTSLVGFTAGVGLFGAITFLPLFLQIAKGASPTFSGILLIPLTVGILVTSNLSGRFMRATGRYRVLMIGGSGALALGLGLLARLSAEMPLWEFAAYLTVVGLGMGAILPVTTTALQNAVAREQIGTATAAGLMFRQVGGAIGVALFGALFGATVAAGLGGLSVDVASLGPGTLAGLSPAEAAQVTTAVVDATHPVFLIGALVAALGFAASFALRELPLSDRLD